LACATHPKDELLSNFSVTAITRFPPADFFRRHRIEVAEP
jgi:hypothetical protein